MGCNERILTDWLDSGTSLGQIIYGGVSFHRMRRSNSREFTMSKTVEDGSDAATLQAPMQEREL